MRSILCLLLLSLTSSKAQLLNLRKSSVKILSHDQNHQAGLKETKSIESMRSVAEITDQDATSQLLTVDHDIKAITGDKILSNDPTRPNLSEQLKETEPTPSNINNNISLSHLEGHALQDQYHSTDMPEWNDVHGGTHDDYSNISFAERQALQDLYESTDGAHWNYGSSSSAGTHWSFDDPDVNPCADVGWYGVHCVDNRITGLSLVGSNLIGTIPESLGQLAMLINLDLGGNLLIGRIPTTLCQIKSLVRVDLEGNSITCYPHCLEHAAVEVKVHPSTPVCNNIPSRSSLSGPSKEAPSSVLMIISSQINIPPLERQALQDLYVSTNGPNWNDYYDIPWNFSNPNANPCDAKWMGVACSPEYRVIQLFLYGDNLRGTIPQSIYQLNSLQRLNLYDNFLIGTIPSTISQLSSLQTLGLSNNDLTGIIPSTFGRLSYLQRLGLNGNQLIGTIPSTIGQLSSLQFLDLGDNQLTGVIPSTIGQLSSVRYIVLRNNHLSGTIPRTIGELSSLQHLRLSNNELTGKVPSSLCNLYLISLQLQDNYLQCYPECLISQVQSLYAEYISVCLSEQPSQEPTAQPTAVLTRSPSAQPTVEPSGPSAQPSEKPTSPSAQPSEKPTAPSAEPTAEPSAESTEAPSAQSSELPTVDTSSSQSTQAPTSSPSTATPTVVPTAQPFEAVVE